MRINEIVSISGLGGLFKIESQKVNGMIVTSLTEGWTKFISNRVHLFSPLENIAIYTNEDTIPIADVLITVFEKKDSNPIIEANKPNDEIRKWFTSIVPDHDLEKVYVSDIKKLIKWFAILESKDVITNEISERLKEKESEKPIDKEVVEKEEN